MRTVRTALLAIALVAATATAGHAQIGFGVAGGPSFPAGDLSNVVNAGFHAGVVAELGIPLFPLGVRADLMLQQMPGIGNNSDFRQLAGTVNGRFGLLPLPFVSAYVTAGAGLYGSSFQPSTGTTDGWTQNAGINGGLGARLNLFVLRPFVEARYHRVMGDQARSFIPVTFGIFF
jgi:hypothetical protein